MPLLRPYLHVLGVRGAWRFSLAAWFARFTRSTTGVGAVLLVVGAGEPAATAGAGSGALVIGAALAGPAWARAADRVGQTRVLPCALAAYACAAALLLVAVQAHLPSWTWITAALLLGAATIDAGALARARWAHLLPDGADQHTAFALEAASDELVFVVGPPVVTVLAGLVSPTFGFVTGAACTIAGGVALRMDRDTAPIPARVARPARRRPRVASLLPIAVLPLLPAYCGIGLVFGSLDLTAVGVGRAVGSTAVTGLLLAAFAIGSVASGIVFGSISRAWSSARRLAVAGTGFALVMLLFPLVLEPVGYAVVCVAGGIATAPVLVAASSRIGQLADRDAVTWALSWPSAGMSVGVTLGAASTGAAIDEGSAYSGLGLPAAAGLLTGVTLLVAAVRAARRGPRRAPHGPVRGADAPAAVRRMPRPGSSR